jgi:hypothetical protein
MNNTIEIRDPMGKLLAYKIGRDLPEGLQAYSHELDFVQVLSWNYQSGKKLQAHFHLQSPRSATHTQEAIVVMSGRLRVDIYGQDRETLRQLLVDSGECMVFLEGGHGYEILEDGTHVFEIKNGPYPGLQADKEKF